MNNIITTSLIPLLDKEFNGEIIKCVDARELYDFLGYESSQFSRWSKSKIVENDFAVENEDWIGFDTIVNGNQVKNYLLTIDFAKRVCLMAKTEKGEQVRRYFIECEKKLKENIKPNIKPMSQLEMMQVLLTQSIEQEKKQKELENRMLLLEAKTTSTNIEFFSISGYSKIKNRKLTLQEATKLGKEASQMSKELGIQIGKIPDQKYGSVQIYHQDVLDEVFKSS